MTDLYETLGVGKDADATAIKKAYRGKAKSAHPDQGGDPEEFHALTVAYETLSDGDARAHYDQTGESKNDRPDNDQAVALSLIDALVQRVLSENGAIHVDIVEAIRRAVQEKIEEAVQGVTTAEQEKSTCDKFLGRLKGEGPIRKLIENKKTQMDSAINNMSKARRVAELALQLLEDESFDPEPRPEQTDTLTYDKMREQVDRMNAERMKRGNTFFWGSTF